MHWDGVLQNEMGQGQIYNT